MEGNFDQSWFIPEMGWQGIPTNPAYTANGGVPSAAATPAVPAALNYTPGGALPPELLQYLMQQAEANNNGAPVQEVVHGGAKYAIHRGEGGQVVSITASNNSPWYDGQQATSYDPYTGQVGSTWTAEDPYKMDWQEKLILAGLAAGGGAMALGLGGAGGAAGAGAMGSTGTAAMGAGAMAPELIVAELAAGSGLGFGAPMGAEALASYAGMAGTIAPEAMAAAMGMTPEAFASLGAGGIGAAGAAGGMTAGTAGATGTAGAAGAAAAGLGAWSSLITPALTALGGYLQHQAAGDAAGAMVGAANNGIAENRRQFDIVRQLLDPYVQAGNRGLEGYENLAGTKGADAQAAQIALLQQGPEFGSYVQQGEDAILQNASATGGLRGGNTQGALAQMRPQILASLIDRQLGRYGSLASQGQASAVGVGNAALGTGARNSSLMQQIGAAEAGGTLAGSNAIVNAAGTIGGMVAGGWPPTVGVPPPVNPYVTGRGKLF